VGEHRGVSLELFIALLKAEGAPGAEQATWKGDGHGHANK
jgi:hypothetical protein